MFKFSSKRNKAAEGLVLLNMDIELITRSPLLNLLNEEILTELADKMTLFHYKRGEVIFREGEIGDQMYFIISGKVKIGRTSQDGRENLLALLGPGEFFGEMSFFDPSPRSATATAAAPTKMAALSHESFNQLLQENPELTVDLLKTLVRRIRRTNESLSDQVFTDVPGRVAKILIQLSEPFGTEVTDGLLVKHDLTQDELAQLIGASRETVNKALAEFVMRGWLRLEARSAVILDVPRLTQRSHA